MKGMTPATLEAAAALFHGTRWKLALPIPGWVAPAHRIELARRVDEITKFLARAGA